MGTESEITQTNLTADLQWDITSNMLPLCFLSSHTCRGGWVFTPHCIAKLPASATAMSHITGTDHKEEGE